MSAAGWVILGFVAGVGVSVVAWCWFMIWAGRGVR